MFRTFQKFGLTVVHFNMRIVFSSENVQTKLSCHVFWIMSRVTVSMADVIISWRCWIFLIFPAYTMFLMYPHRKKSSGERSGLRGGQSIGPPLPIHASGNLSFKTSFTKHMKWGGAPSCIMAGWSRPHGYHPNQPHRNSKTHRNKNTQPMWWHNRKAAGSWWWMY